MARAPLDAGAGTAGVDADVVADIEAARAAARSAGCHLALVGVALANASEIAEVHGSRALDAATERVAARATAAHRGCRTVRTSAHGGFLLAVPVPRTSATDRVAHLTARMRDFVDLPGGGSVWPVVTSGVRLCEDHDDPAAVLRDVRGTLQDAVVRTPGRTRWHDPVVRRPPAAVPVDPVRDLAWALRARPEQLGLAYQPVRSLGTGDVIGVEALLRWTHPVHGAVPAAEAVRAAERSGLVHDLGRWVLTAALRQAAGWRRAGAGPLTVHVNVSAFELREPGFAAGVARLVRASGLPARSVLLEVTETDLSAGDADVLRSLHELCELGVRLGIDDFGTGYSSIGQLRALPVDTVKVDRSLVAGIATSPEDLDLLSTVLALLTGSGLTVVAEGIETSVQAAHLRALGCPAGQGYHLGRPAPAETLFGGCC